MTKHCKDIINIVITFILIPLLLIEQGWAVSTLWLWFITPLGLPAIGIATAIGICITISLIRMRQHRKDNDDEDADSKFERIAYNFVVPLVAVTLGWIVKLFA